MNPTREQIYAALLAKAETLLAPGPFVQMSRRLPFVEEVAMESMPSLHQFQTNQTPIGYDMDQGVYGWWMDAEWYVYCAQPDTSQPSTPILNPLVDAVCDLLAVGDTSGEPSTLTVTVGADDFNCAITLNGAVQVWEGLLGNRAVAIIPVRVQVPYT